MTERSAHRERPATLVIGIATGIAAALPIVVFGFPAVVLSLAVVALATVGLRSFAFVSGAFIGAGATWLAVLLRAQLACEAFDRLPNAGCTGPDLTPYASIALGVALVGVVLGVVALRRPRARGQAAG